MAAGGFRQGSVNDRQGSVKWLNDPVNLPAWAAAGPVAKDGLDQRQRRYRSGIGAQDPRPQRQS
jgi:hypothetical protein